MNVPLKPFRVSVVQCRGTPYEVGRAQARLFARPEGELSSATRRPDLRGGSIFGLSKECSPNLLPRLGKSLSDLLTNSALPSSGLPFGSAIILCRPPIGACSAAITANVYGRNYDYRPATTAPSSSFCRAGGSYARIGSSHQLTGRLDGMNEHGLLIGLHQVKKSPRFPGLSADLIVRMILDQCSTTAEAVEKLRRLPHAMQYNYSLLDANGVASVVEAGAGAVAERKGAWLACTNHFQSALLRPLNHRRRTAHSQQRLPPLEAWASGGLSAEQMFTALNRSTSPAFFHGYFRGGGTLHTIVGEPAKRRLLIGIGGDAAALEEDMLDVSFGRWVAGEDLPISQLQGQLGGMSRPVEWPRRPERRRPNQPARDARH